MAKSTRQRLTTSRGRGWKSSGGRRRSCYCDGDPTHTSTAGSVRARPSTASLQCSSSACMHAAISHLPRVAAVPDVLLPPRHCSLPSPWGRPPKPSRP
jgi:hypothetical protein